MELTVAVARNGGASALQLAGSDVLVADLAELLQRAPA
jgi:hypothetical protein